MSGSIPIQIRGTPSNGPPVGLVERQLAVEMNNGNLWAGVPVSIDVTGRILLNPRRLPAGGSEWQALIKGTGTNFGWADAGDRGNANTVLGAAALPVPVGTDNTAVGSAALADLLAGAAANTALGSLAGQGGTVSTNSVFVGSGAVPSANNDDYEIVIGANTTGAGSNTASIGHWTGPSMVNEFWIGGRDLLRVGQPSAYVDGTQTSGNNDDTVYDLCTTTLVPGLWLVILRCSIGTSTATPWIHYEFGLNYAAAQTTIDDSAQFKTTTSSTYQAQFSHVVFVFNPSGPQQIWGSMRAQNATNSGTWAGAVAMQPVRLM